MDVDGEDDDEGTSTEDDDDEEEEGDNSMSVDGEEGEEGSPEKNKKNKKRKGAKLKSRKSELNFEALTQEQAAVAALEADELLHLKLKKKYYAEAMQFMRQLDGAMENLKKLLGSLNKAEVLETMEFFRVAYEYQLKDAKVSAFPT